MGSLVQAHPEAPKKESCRSMTYRTLLFLTFQSCSQFVAIHKLASRTSRNRKWCHHAQCGCILSRSDVQALDFRQLVAGFYASQSVFVFDELKFEPMYFFPRRLHISDVSHEVLVFFSRQVSNLERRHYLLLLVLVVSDVCILF